MVLLEQICGCEHPPPPPPNQAVVDFETKFNIVDFREV